MAYIVKTPELGSGTKPGELSAWLISEGDEVTEGDSVTEIESEGMVAEIDAKEDGVLRRAVFVEGGSTTPDDALAIVTDADEDTSDLEADADVGKDGSRPVVTDSSTGGSPLTEVTKTTETAATGGGNAPSVAQSRSRGPGGALENGEICASPRAKRPADDLGVDLTTVEGTRPQGVIIESDMETAAESTTVAAAEGRVFVPPSTRRLARELGVDIEVAEGMGQSGRIIRSNVRAAGGATTAATNPSVAGAATTATTNATAVSEPVKTERSLSGVRRTIAGRLGEGYREVVHVAVDHRIGAERLLATANAAADALGVDVLITNILLLTLLALLDEHPKLNATSEDGVHRLHGKRDVYIVVNANGGLIAPVVRDAASLSLSKLAEIRTEAAQRMLSGDFTMDDLSGGTFAVSNLGVLGVELFDPIINPPQVAILDVNTIRRKAVPTDDGDMVVRRVISFSSSFDYCIVDRADIAHMLGTLVEHVGSP